MFIFPSQPSLIPWAESYPRGHAARSRSLSSIIAVWEGHAQAGAGDWKRERVTPRDGRGATKDGSGWASGGSLETAREREWQRTRETRRGQRERASGGRRNARRHGNRSTRRTSDNRRPDFALVASVPALRGEPPWRVKGDPIRLALVADVLAVDNTRVVVTCGGRVRPGAAAKVERAGDVNA